MFKNTISKSNVTFFLIGKKYGFNLKKNIDFVMKSQFWSSQQIVDYQNEHLKSIIKHAYEHVPFYRDIMNTLAISPSSVKEINDLEKFPIIRKDDVSKQFNQFLADDFRRYRPLSRSSGGTTGIAFPFYNDIKSWGLNWAIKIRTFRWGDFKYSRDLLGVLAGGSLLLDGSISWKNRLWKYLNNYVPLMIMHMDDISLGKYIQLLERKNVRFLRGYPTAIYTLAKHLKTEGRQLPMKSIFTTAEMLHDHQRLLMEDVFGCKIFDTYGCGEGMGSANECEHHMGLHTSFETSVFSVVDKNGKEVGPGEEGEIILTSLNDFTMPFIRYAPGDLAIKSDQKCTCGRNLPLLKKIIGRTSDLIELPNGRKINGLSIPFEAWGDRIVKFQIVQTEADLIEVNLIPKDTYTSKDDETVIQIMRTHAGEGIRLRVNHVENIPLPESGKFRYVISKVTQQK